MEYIVLSEISRKQDFIFRSNKLKENIGASIIIKYITEELSNKYVTQFHGDVIYEAGGKVLYRFKELDSVKNFVREFSKEVVIEFSGIELFIIHQAFDPKVDEISTIIDEAYKKLERKKSERKTTARQISFGLHKICHSTQMPATYIDGGKPISSEIHKKIEFSKKHESYFSNLLPKGYKYPLEFDDLKGAEKSFIAVVYIDGNQMGKKLKLFKELHRYTGEISLEQHNEMYLHKLAEFSQNIADAYEEAFKEMTNVLSRDQQLLQEKLKIDQAMLPIRPLIVAGDDITYVTNGEIGIETARIFLEKLSSKHLTISDTENIPLNASAGVAIVKSHYPFSKAYKLAEELSENGKRRILSDYKEKDFSILDWHIVYGELSGSLQQIRKQYYQLKDTEGTPFSLTMKPLYLNNKDSFRSYSNFKESLKNISKSDVARSKLKELREVFKEGPSRSKVFIEINQLNSLFNYLGNMQLTNGFTTDHVCLYFDAIEMMDLFIEIKEEK
ncbi:Cas10/Cmr2 second palm domain-containing protein [Tepidibacillus fermentans]|uniref:Cas10/Cmr2 second palm domain-containing protein n=1 Tax=Tepidibacillus fermentans TaxID=1281767 RepID=A0A4R3K7J6_9BACI|nr:hypothetical protein [Tepidibacillus fermentans]TCS78936.1 hypothetical protein EDD72_12415 [Tepidibacillus fermentans]